MAEATPQKVKRVTKKAKAPVVSGEAPQTPEVVDESNSKATSASTKEKEIRLTEIPVVDEITALNIMVSFLGLAQKRGAYTIDEASKIWECIKKFQRPSEPVSA
uniref:Uncharacterized protein n=1 Tax=viral metagenome TaxID=1070528 RepID=A0A6C0E3D6_9ZZZZ